MIEWLTFVEATIALMRGQTAGAIAVIGAVTGIAALGWNIWRSVRDASQLHLSYSVHRLMLTDSADLPAAVTITIANAGTLPAYIIDAQLVTRVGWTERVPILRSLSFRARRSQPLRLLYKTDKAALPYPAYFDFTVRGRLEPGEMKSSHARDASTLVSLQEPFPGWLLVTTGLRYYTTRVIDNRDISKWL